MKALYFDNDLLRVLTLKAASLVDKNAALGPFSTLRYGDVPEPALPGPRWIKVKNLSCGLCGTDLHFMFMDLDPRCFPAAIPGVKRKFLGHELLGRVIEAGAEAGDFSPGDRVALRIDWPSCHQLEIQPPCPQCAKGNYMLCERQGERALPVANPGGGFSPIMVMHKSQAYKIPEGLSDDEALLLEPMASALHGVLASPPQAGEKLLVIGAGSIGLLAAFALCRMQPQAECHILTRYAFQAQAAEKLGAKVVMEGEGLYERLAERSRARHIKGYLGNEILLGGFDRVYDTVGNDQSLHNALRWTKGGGSVVLIGINFKPGRLDYTPIWNQEVSVKGINCHATEADGRTSFDHAAELLLRHDLSPADLITHRYPVERYKDAVKTFLAKGRAKSIKIVLDHG